MSNFFGRRKLPDLELGMPEAPTRIEAERLRELPEAERERFTNVVRHAERTYPITAPELRVENGYLLEGHRIVAKLETTDVDCVYRVLASYRAIRWLLITNRLLVGEVVALEEAAREETVSAEPVARLGADA